MAARKKTQLKLLIFSLQQNGNHFLYPNIVFCVGVESIDNNLKFSIKNFFMCMRIILKEEFRGVLSLRFPILMSSYRNRRFLWSWVSVKKTSDNLHRIRCLGLV